jgi:hypothetical protein
MMNSKYSRKAVTVFAFASLISGMSISSAYADNDDGHGRDRHDNRGQQERRGDRDQHDWRNDRERNWRRPEYRHPYTYAQPVYVPPPVYDEPRPSPGISLFFPLDLRR